MNSDNTAAHIGMGDDESNTLVVSDITACISSKIDPHLAAFIALRTVHPELCSDDIISVKNLPKRESLIATGTKKKTCVSAGPVNNEKTENSNNSRGTPALLVRLARSVAVESILKSKSKFTRLKYSRY